MFYSRHLSFLFVHSFVCLFEKNFSYCINFAVTKMKFNIKIKRKSISKRQYTRIYINNSTVNSQHCKHKAERKNGESSLKSISHILYKILIFQILFESITSNQIKRSYTQWRSSFSE